MTLNNIGVITNYEQVESFRTLRTNLLFSGAENKTVVITSSRPGDGKSTVCQNLARSLANDGKKVLLLDCDLRKSKMIQFFTDVDEVYGVSHIISRNQTLDNCIYKTDLENFHVIPAGHFPPNPTELLGSVRFKKLIAILRTNYDYVIIDTPPIGSVVDAAVISRECDGTIMVIESNITTKKEAKISVDAMKKANHNIIGAVLNKFDNKKSKHYGYTAYGNYEYKEGNQK